MTASFLLSLLISFAPNGQAHTQKSLPGFKPLSCEFIFEVLPAANESHDSSYVVATGKSMSAVYRYERLEVYSKHETDPTLDILRFEFDPEFGGRVLSMEFTRDEKYLMVTGETRTKVYRMGIGPILVLQSEYQTPHYFHYDSETEFMAIQAGDYLSVQNLRENQTEMLMPVAASRSLARSISNNQVEFFHMIYMDEGRDSGRFLIEKNDPVTGKMVGVLSTNFAELRWYKQEQILTALLKKEGTTENRSAFMLRTIRFGLLESIRFLLQNPGASLTP